MSCPPPSADRFYDCVVVGAGIAGLMAAHRMVREGWRVVVVEKSRGVGGRMATRRWNGGVFDHGAQFFTVRDDRFRRYVERWRAGGVVDEWYRFGRPEEVHFRGVPGMTAIPKQLAADLDVLLETPVTSLRHDPSGLWTVQTGNGALHARSLLLTAPVPQSLALLDAAGGVALAPADRGRLAAVRYHRCLALLLVLDRPASITGHGGALKLDHPDIQWIGNNQEKGLCPATPAVTVHSSAAFATAHWDSPDAQRVPHLLEAVAPFIRSRVTAWSCHRWRFAQPRCSFGEEAFCDRGLRLAIAGDGLAGGRVEGAAVSGLAAASGLLASPGAPVNPMTV